MVGNHTATLAPAMFDAFKLAKEKVDSDPFSRALSSFWARDHIAVVLKQRTC